jgi:hypothetical protein
MNRTQKIILIVIFLIVLLTIGVGTSSIREYFNTDFTLEDKAKLEATSALIKQLSEAPPQPSGMITLPGNRKGVLIHERDLYGLPGQNPVRLNHTRDTLISRIYNPFGYGNPPVREGMTRMYRLYVVYSDNITTNHDITLSVCNDSGADCSHKINFSIPKTWGTIRTGAQEWSRDAYTDLKPASDFKENHSALYGKVNASGSVAIIRKVVLQSWDILA